MAEKNSDIMVSIVCDAYNHEKYIADALEGFLMQKTNFAFEILVHDDASTDRTAEIIRDYEKRYPNLIKPIYEIENQWSKNHSSIDRIQCERARGKYIALCEGDDYWINPSKLQIQVDYMEVHPQCTFCATNGIIKNVSNSGTERIFFPYSERDKEFYVFGNKEVALDTMYRYSFLPTASYLYRKETRNKFPDEYYSECQHGDLKLRLYCASLGYMYFFDEITCVYRKNVPNSATTNWKKSTKAETYRRENQAAAMISNIDSFTNYLYSDQLFLLKEYHIAGMLFTEASIFHLLKDIQNEEKRQAFKNFPVKRKLWAIITAISPDNLIRFIRSIRHRVKNNE